MHWQRTEHKRRRRQTSLEGKRHLLHIHAPAYDGELEWLYNEIRKLEKIDRSLILLSLDGTSYQEMAKIVGISETNVGVKLNRIRNRLAKAAKEVHRGSQ